MHSGGAFTTLGRLGVLATADPLLTKWVQGISFFHFARVYALQVTLVLRFQEAHYKQCRQSAKIGKNQDLKTSFLEQRSNEGRFQRGQRQLVRLNPCQSTQECCYLACWKGKRPWQTGWATAVKYGAGQPAHHHHGKGQQAVRAETYVRVSTLCRLQYRPGTGH